MNKALTGSEETSFGPFLCLVPSIQPIAVDFYPKSDKASDRLSDIDQSALTRIETIHLAIGQRDRNEAEVHDALSTKRDRQSRSGCELKLKARRTQVNLYQHLERQHLQFRRQ